MKKKLLWLVAPLAIGILVGCEPIADEDAEGDGEETTEDVTGSTETAIGIPDWDSFSISIDDATVAGAYNVDGQVASISVQVADRHNHPVEDDTAVFFWTEYGRIEDSCSTTNGSCSVTWTSGGVRPIDGLSTVLAYTVGEDSYIETGISDGIYNIAADSPKLATDEAILSSPEMYYDRNFDGFTSTQFPDGGSGLTLDNDAFVDYNDDGVFNSSSSKFRGTDCSAGAIAAGHCAESRILVWNNAQLTLASANDSATVSIPGAATIGSEFIVTVQDSRGNRPITGTEISIVSDSDATFKASFPNGNKVLEVGSTTAGAYGFSVIIDEGATGNTATVSVKYGDRTYTGDVTY